MKKQLLVLFVALLVLLASIYIFFPAQVTVARKLTLPVNQNAVARLLTDKAKWQKWWPQNTAIRYDSLNFLPEQKLLKGAVIHVPFSDSSVGARLQTINYRTDTSSVIFQLQFPPAGNPVERLSYYFRNKKIADEIDVILRSLEHHATKMETIYGMDIRQETVKDTAFVAIRFQSDGYPAPAAVYQKLNELNAYLQAQSARATGLPMLHAETLNGAQYNVIVAVPADRLLPGNGRIEPKRMIRGNILVGEVRGGASTVQQAMQEMQHYVEDHHRRSPAIPFESLVTNRLQEQDTSKWITRLYYPVL